MAARESRHRWLRGWGALVAAAVLAGGGYLVYERWGAEEPAASPERPAAPVEVATVASATLEETVRGVGSLRASERVEIRPKISGRVRAIHFEEGGRVEEGHVLFELDDEKLLRQRASRQAALRGATVRVADARRTFQRQKDLYERQAASQDERDRAEAEYEAAQAEQEQFGAELELIEEELSDTRIRAPFDGVISEREVDRGAYISTGDTLATVYQADPVEVAFSVPERYMGRVLPGQGVGVVVAAYPGEPFEGEAHFVSPAVDEATRTFRVRARVPNPEGRLKPGAFATAVVTVNVREDRPVVPEESLVGTRQGYMVFVVVGGHAQARHIQTGLRRGGVVEVIDGLSVGETVVRMGHLRLSDGERVALAGEAERETTRLPDAEGMVVAEDPEVSAGGGAR